MSTRLHRFTHSRIALVITSVLATAALTGGIAWAVQSPVSGGVVHGCYNPATGSFQLKVTTNCPTTGNKDPVNWNIPGAKGTTGAQGPAAPPPREYVTWHVNVPSGATADSVKSSTLFEQGSNVETFGEGLTGNFSACAGGYSVDVRIHLEGTPSAQWNHPTAGGIVSNVGASIVGGETITTSPAVSQPLEVHTITCFNASHVAIKPPAFSLSLKVLWTHAEPKLAIT